MWNEIDARMLAHFGAPGYKGEYKEHVLGKSFPIALSFYRDRFGIAGSVDEMIEVRTQIATEFYTNHIPMYPGVADVLAELRSLGLRIALATSSVSDCILPFLKRHGITEAFDAIITGEMVKNGKPHPDIYLLAASKVEIDPRDCLVIEDALSGLQAGRGAGAHTVAIPDPRWLDPAQFEGKADFQVQQLTEVPALVRSLLGP